MARRHLMAAAAIATACGCARPITTELAGARAVYAQAETGAAAQIAPETVHDARRALVRAESVHIKMPGSREERDLAYVAARKAQVAIAQAELAEAEQALVDAGRTLAAARERANEAEMRAAFTALQRAQERLENAEERVGREAAARAAAEAAAREAHDELVRVASVRSEPRGLVISVSSEVLFESGRDLLLPSARRVLDEVAAALRQQPPESTVTVAGHTDAIGSAAANLALSSGRAEAVRRYLVERGIDGSRIHAVGMGEEQPIADNATPEGRANNRRVEIILVRAPEQAMR